MKSAAVRHVPASHDNNRERAREPWLQWGRPAWFRSRVFRLRSSGRAQHALWPPEVVSPAPSRWVP
eukprot:4489882-Prymnesium_polylepis.1